MTLLLSILACNPPADTGKSPTESSPNEDSVPISAGDSGDTPTDCVEDADFFPSVSVEVTDVPTVLRVRWETTEATDGYLRYSDGVVDLQTPLSGAETTSHETLLLGMPADTYVSAQIVAGARCSPTLSGQTGTLPGALPPLSVDVLTSGASSYTLVPVITANGSYITILDGLGRYVWVYEADYPGIYRARRAVDGTGVLFIDPVNIKTGITPIEKVGWDGAPLQTWSIWGAHTDFLEHEDGTLATLSWDIRDYNGQQLMADTIVEVAPDGTQTELWNGWDHFTPDPYQTYLGGFYPPDPSVADWLHANYLAFDGEDYYVTAANVNTLLRIDRATGAQEWAVQELTGGGADEATIFNIHSIQPLGDDHFLVFNRNDFVTVCSEAIEVTVDGSAETLTQTWSYENEACYMIYYLGEARRLDNGHTRLTWTTAGVIEEIDATNTTVAQFSLSLGAGFAYIEPLDSLY